MHKDCIHKMQMQICLEVELGSHRGNQPGEEELELDLFLDFLLFLDFFFLREAEPSESEEDLREMCVKI